MTKISSIKSDWNFFTKISLQNIFKLIIILETIQSDEQPILIPVCFFYLKNLNFNHFSLKKLQILFTEKFLVTFYWRNLPLLKIGIFFPDGKLFLPYDIRRIGGVVKSYSSKILSILECVQWALVDRVLIVGP